jgi:hypothetical protein
MSILSINLFNLIPSAGGDLKRDPDVDQKADDKKGPRDKTRIFLVRKIGNFKVG